MRGIGTAITLMLLGAALTSVFVAPSYTLGLLALFLGALANTRLDTLEGR